MFFNNACNIQMENVLNVMVLIVMYLHIKLVVQKVNMHKQVEIVLILHYKIVLKLQMIQHV